MARTKVKPASGMIVLDPATKRPLSADGAMVVLDSYWRRRIAEGAIVVVEDTKKEKQSEQVKSGGGK